MCSSVSEIRSSETLGGEKFFQDSWLKPPSVDLMEERTRRIRKRNTILIKKTCTKKECRVDTEARKLGESDEKQISAFMHFKSAAGSCGSQNVIVVCSF